MGEFTPKSFTALPPMAPMPPTPPPIVLAAEVVEPPALAGRWHSEPLAEWPSGCEALDEALGGPRAERELPWRYLLTDDATSRWAARREVAMRASAAAAVTKLGGSAKVRAEERGAEEEVGRSAAAMEDESEGDDASDVSLTEPLEMRSTFERRSAIPSLLPVVLDRPLGGKLGGKGDAPPTDGEEKPSVT